MDTRSQAEQVLRSFLQTSDRADAPAEDTTPLHAGGLGLDSLETAELSAVLEDELGKDPFSEGLLPATVGELLDFYTDSAVPS